MNDFQPKIFDKERMLSQLSFQDRKIMIYDTIDEDSIFRAIFYLMRIYEIDAKIGVKKPIEICINSNGGAIYDGLSLISLIESMKEEGYEINTVNMGYSFSMGFLISLVGTHRKAYRYSSYMIHDPSSFSAGKLEALKDEVKESERVRDIIVDIVLKYTDIPKSELMNVFNTKSDQYYSADQALKLKICDEII